MAVETMEPLDFLRERKLAFADLMGIVFVSADKDKVVAELEVTPQLCPRPTTIHGGALMAFADTLGAAGTILNLPEGATTTTLESKTNFISSAPVGARIVGEATPLHRGSRTMVWQTRITNAEGKLVAMVTQTQLIFPKPAKSPQ